MPNLLSNEQAAPKSQKPSRRSLRLPDYDYAQPGAYFITICTHKREALFGEIIAGEMRTNQFGEIVCSCWGDLPNHYPHVKLDAFMIMPNHVHGIIHLIETDPARADFVGAGLRPAPTDADPTIRHGLPEILRAFKSFSARKINELRGTPGLHLWQRNYYEHVIRNEEALAHIQEYVMTNPLRWSFDRENPARRTTDDFDRWFDKQGNKPFPGRES